ncbi:LacI family DNA-binding transcriptional regulator [Pedobacter glucosidilyticus]|uniref:LacI family DNA-binding transcriptional regulator n=1 Tax=Pedobacter glucosidilyticus TaxID=1122941 RepID=UPI0004179058|nr:LacI family DNA-binding transcriptional regulator [Pedobacter glucosidilyticus]
MKSRQVTIIDIAKALNISKSTVSRALTNHPNINPETKKAVLELAQEMDYQRNMLSISLVTNKTNTIGIIVPELVNSYFSRVIIGSQEAAYRAGYNVIICQSNENYDQEISNVNIMLSSRVDGVLVSMTKETRNFDHLKRFEKKGIPIVFFNRVCDEMIVPKVIVDDFEGAFKLTEHLIEIGKRRIAHLAGPDNLIISRKRKEGYLAALKKHQIDIDEELIIPYDLNLDKVKIYVNHLINLPNKPDAIFAINDPTAIEVIQILKSKKIRIPTDIAVAGFSNDNYSAFIDPPLTTVAQPVEEIGKVATELLIDQINRDVKDWKAITKMLDTQLVIRNSTQ